MARRDRPNRLRLPALGGATVAVVCCAAPPLVVAGAPAGVSIAAPAGAGAAGVVILGVVAGALAVVRSRRSGERREGTG